MNDYKPKTPLGKAGARIARLFTPHHRHVQPKPNEGHTHDENGEAESESEHHTAPPRPVVQPVQRTVDEPEAEQSYTAARQETQPTKPDVSTRRLQAWLPLVISLLTLVVIIIHAYFYNKQWQAMTRQSEIMGRQSELMAKQLEAMNGSSNQTNDLIAATRETANASQSVAEQNKELVKHAGEQAAASQTQAKASVAQADVAKQSLGAAQSSARAAERSSDTASQALSAGERAYIGVDNVGLVGPPIGQHPKISVTFVNGGKTPASHFIAIGHISWGNIFIPPTWNPTLFAANEGAFLPAGAKTTVIFEDKYAPLTDQEISEVRAGTRKLFVGIETHYVDFLNREQVFSFCALYNASDSNFIDCAKEQ
jgi:hypothetical protein